MDKKEILASLIGPASLRSWGTVLDSEDVCPPKYLHADFEEMNHDDIAEFIQINDEEKFRFAYWAQHNHSKQAAKVMFIAGFVTAIILMLIIWQFLVR